MREQRITVTIDDIGRISADAEGFTGDLCLKDLERLLDGLSPGTVQLQRKPDAGAGRVQRTQSLGKKP